MCGIKKLLVRSHKSSQGVQGEDHFEYLRVDSAGNSYTFGYNLDDVSIHPKRIFCVSIRRFGHNVFSQELLVVHRNSFGHCYYDIAFRSRWLNIESATEIVRILLDYARENGVYRIEGTISELYNSSSVLGEFYRKLGFHFHWGQNKYGVFEGKIWMDLATICGPTRPISAMEDGEDGALLPKISGCGNAAALPKAYTLS
jgi:hypothetical protein